VTFFLDLETYCTRPIKNGTYQYAEHAEVLLFAWALDDGPVHVEEVNGDLPALMKKLRPMIYKADRVVAHNSSFDRNVLRYNGVDIPIEKWEDTMVRAYMHGLPGSLGQLSQIYRLPVDKAKDAAGKRLIRLFCIPDKDGVRHYAKDHPEEWRAFKSYAGLDIEAMRELDRLIPRWNMIDVEIEAWRLDQKINDRGFFVDQELAKGALECVEREKKILNRRTKEITNGAIESTTRRDALLKHALEAYGVNLPDMQMSTIQRRIQDPELPLELKELLTIRSKVCLTSNRKYKALLDGVNSDGRLRGTIQFCGAPTSGRASGRLYQPQNQPRPKPDFKKADLIEEAVDALKTGNADLLYDSVADAASSCIRGALIASEGKKLVVSDLASIEARVLPWLAGEQWVLDAYAAVDRGEGYDLYVLTYARTFNVDPSDVTSSQRQLGKTISLALGYGGGVGAFLTFASVYGIDLNDLAKKAAAAIPKVVRREAESYYTKVSVDGNTYGLTKDAFVACDSVKRMWRNANPKIVRFWYDLEDAVRRAVVTGEDVVVGRCVAKKRGSWLTLQLPSGRSLSFPGMSVVNEKLRYFGTNQYSKKWMPLKIYSGKIAGVVTQATARDGLYYNMPRAEKQGYEVLLSVHDELITETPDTDEYSHEKLSEILATNPPWADGLPLAAEGYEGYRYRKG